ncbi:MAG: HAD-IA family hydrolase [Acidobacteria bacterium]|nr:HAD-IA family hydrolase [Acidobacteriota bacterium]
MHQKLTAVVWDFDGTLVDTRRKNMNVARALVKHITGSDPDEFQALQDLAGYEPALHRHRHWRDFYRQELRMGETDIDRTEEHWLEFQIADETPAEIYDGIREVLETFAHLPQGIVSLNIRANITRFLAQLEIDRHFGKVLGAEDVETGYQKPHPHALVRCIEQLTCAAPGLVVYVGDHETDVECAHRANDHFQAAGTDIRVVSVGALYAPHLTDDHWDVEPDGKATAPREILSELTRIFAALP